MFLESWGEVFSYSLQNLWLGFIGFVPDLILAIIFFIVGWVVGAAIGRLIERGLNALNVNSLFEGVNAHKVMERAGFKLDVGKFFGEIIKWFIIIVFLMSSLEILNLNQVNAFLNDAVLTYLPKVIIAALILVLASVLATAVRKFVEGGAKAMGVQTARLLGSISFYAIWIFAFIIALSELGIAAQFMQILFTGVVAMLALAGGLAFGLGGRDAASRAIESVRNDVQSHRKSGHGEM